MEDFELDIIIDRQAARIEDCDPGKISALAREKIRSDVKDMLGKDFDFQTADQITELSRTIQGWMKEHPNP